MIKKLKSAKARVANPDVVAQLRGNARDVWLAGLGAFAAVQADGGKLVATTQSESAKVFNALVKQGKDIEARTKQAAVEQATTVGNRTTQVIDKLEQVFQNRVARSLARLGIPSNDEVAGLTRQVEQL
ncbi:MAG: phasin family protein, partial [Pseudonocardiaceae bacterium]